MEAVLRRLAIALIAFFLTFAATLFYPAIDLRVSRLFYTPGAGFLWANNPVLQFLHHAAVFVPLGIAVFLVVALIIALCRRNSFLMLTARSWAFLLLALILIPGMIVNVGFKDHWGRARPREVQEFGGAEVFSPAYLPQPNARRNGSFVSGDPATGFTLLAVGFVVTPRSSRRWFLAAIITGFTLGLMRIVMGGHFLSDVLATATICPIAVSVLAVFFWGRENVKERWQIWLGANSAQKSS